MLETLHEAVNRNRNGQILASAGATALLLAVGHDVSVAPSWAALLTPAAIGGILIHVAGALLLYRGAKRQDPAA